MRTTALRALAVTMIMTCAGLHLTATPAQAAVHKYGAWVEVKTFIPQNRIDAPRVGCSYGNGYAFGGDNRSYSASSSKARTKLVANIRFDKNDPRLIGSSRKIGATTVYKKSTGKLVATKTASGSRVTVKEMALSDSQKVDLRFSIHAGNPFCSAGAISGAFTMTLYKDGRYVIRSGAHRQMPNWEVYAGWIGGNPTTVYRRGYASAACLVAMVCSEAQMGGYSGRLRG